MMLPMGISVGAGAGNEKSGASVARSNSSPARISAGLIGAILVTVIYDQTLEYYRYQLLAFGLIMVLLVVFMPNGIGGLIDRRLVAGESGRLALRAPEVSVRENLSLEVRSYYGDSYEFIAAPTVPLSVV